MVTRSYCRIVGCWICRALLGLVFVYAAITKLSTPQDFADSIAAYQLLPLSVINLIAWSLPLFELSCGLFILTGFYFRIATLGILLMLVVFMTAIVMALIRGLPINCGCFGSLLGLDTNPWLALIRDAILLILATVTYRTALIEGLGKRGPAHCT